MEDSGHATPTSYGLPRPLIPKQLVSLSGDRSLLVHSYLLETAVGLGTLGGLHQAIGWGLTETVSAYVAIYPILLRLRPPLNCMLRVGALGGIGVFSENWMWA